VTTTLDTSALRLDYVRLGDLQRWPKNPKGHDLPELEASMKRFGFTAPLILDETTGRLVAGHGRLETLQALRDAGHPPPRGIQVDDDGHWLVPVVRGVAFPSEAEAAAYVLADNAITMLGGWLEDLLRDQLRTVQEQTGDLAGTGFKPEHLDALLAKAHPDQPEDPPIPHPDQLAELVKKWGVEPGDLWLLDRHRLVCGDSGDPDTVKAAIGDLAPVMMWADPPYGIAYESKRKHFGRIAGDDAVNTAWLALYAPIPVWYVCTRWDVAPAWMAAITAAGHQLRNWIVWHKSRGGIGDTLAQYRPTHEAILHSERRRPKDQPKGDPLDPLDPLEPLEPNKRRRGGYRQEHETILYSSSRRIGFAHGGRDNDVWHHAPDSANAYLHPTQKPVALPARAIRNHSRVGDAIIDPFAGAGASLLAAHQLDRTGIAIELDPRYVAATLERAASLGISPRKAGKA